MFIFSINYSIYFVAIRKNKKNAQDRLNFPTSSTKYHCALF